MTTCSRILPGRPESARQAREFVARCLPGCPAADAAVLITSEFVTNSVRHSRSGLGGKVRIRVIVAAGVWVRIEVRDDGPVVPGALIAPARPDVTAESGRGLWLARELSEASGADGRGLVWARIAAARPGKPPRSPLSGRPARCAAWPAITPSP
jgi:hypothetical protein